MATKKKPAPPQSKPTVQATTPTAARLPALRQLDRMLGPWMPYLILGLATFLRINDLARQSLWADEGNSVALAGRSFGEIAQAAALDIHPPLYYWLLSLWTRIFGTSEVAVRSLSVVLGVATVWLVYLLGRRLFGRVAGLVAAFLLAMSPLHVYYSQEARMYALLAFWAALLMLGFVRIVQDEMADMKNLPRELPLLGTTAGFVYVIAGIGGLYTHYLFPIMLAICNVIYVIWLATTWRTPYRRLRITRWLFLQLVIVVGYWAWLGIGLERIRAWPAPDVTQQGLPALVSALKLLAFGPTARVVPDIWFVPVVALLILGVWPFALGLRRRLPPHQARWPAWAVAVGWLAAPIVLMLLLNLFKEAYLKFLVIAAPAFALVLARGLLLPLALVREQREQAGAGRGMPPGRTTGIAALTWLTVGLVGVAMGSAISLSAYYNDPTLARDDYRRIARTIDALATPDDVVLLNAPGQGDVFDYYYHGSLPVLALPAERPPDAVKTIQTLEQKLADHHRVYGIFWATNESDPQRVVETWLDQNAFKVQDSWFGNVRLVTYALPEEMPSSARALDVALDDVARLQGVSMRDSPVPAGDVVQLSLHWLAGNPGDTRYKVFLQLLDADSQIVAQRDAEPVGESRPTNTWQPGETIVDRHGLLVPPGTPPGTYRLITGLYDRANGRRVSTSEGDAIELGTVQVVRPITLPSRDAFTILFDRRETFGPVDLLGFSRYPRGYGHAPETALHPGDLLHIDLFWQSQTPAQTDLWALVSLGDLPGNRVIEARRPLGGRGYPTSQWETGEIVRDQLDLPLPPDLPRGEYPLHLAVYAEGGEPFETVTLGTIRVS